MLTSSRGVQREQLSLSLSIKTMRGAEGGAFAMKNAFFCSKKRIFQFYYFFTRVFFIVALEKGYNALFTFFLLVLNLWGSQKVFFLFVSY